ncbi:hypothetical protein Pmani_022841, partial [Petrolisthes manimaculis]
SLDEVQVEMETCQELRSQASHTVMPSYSSGGGYGFVDKVSDGMTVTVNAFLVTFPSHAFHASFQGGGYGFVDKVSDGMTVTVNAFLVTFPSHAFHASFQGGGYGFVDKVSDGMTVTVNAFLVTFPSHAFHASFQGGGYGFVDKVSDGMTVTVNAFLVTFPSHAFHASFQLSRIVLDSKSPLWQKADLRSTRLKDPERGELLIFKELSWQTLRREARSTKDPALTPTRPVVASP